MGSRHSHISQKFDSELEDIRSQVLGMGGLVEDHLNKILDAISRSDRELADFVAHGDDEIDRMEVGIDGGCTEIILRRQPAAGDLRLVLAVSRTITDLERMGDEVEKIARMVCNLLDSDTPRSYYMGLLSLGHHVRRTLHEALDAFARGDGEAALTIATSDPDIDRESESIMRLLITYMIEDPRSITRVLDIVLAVRAFERIGDHSANICENVIYLVLGKDVRHTKLADIKQEFDRN